MKSLRSVRIVFVTGTDTGVGKTVLTGLLLSHLRQSGHRAYALKPFCSGGRDDAELLFQLQDCELPLDIVNPWHFPEPVAPLVAARKQRQNVCLSEVLQHIRRTATDLQDSTIPLLHRSMTPTLLIEGAGGLLVPLGRGFCVLDLIVQLRCEVLLVSANRLGTINHTLLSVQALRAARLSCRVIFMETGKPDPSSKTNARLLLELLSGVRLFQLPFLGPSCGQPLRIVDHAKRLRSRLHQILKDC